MSTFIAHCQESVARLDYVNLDSEQMCGAGCSNSVWNHGLNIGGLDRFRFLNGAIRSPDPARVSDQRLNTLRPEQHRGFIALCGIL